MLSFNVFLMLVTLNNEQFRTVQFLFLKQKLTEIRLSIPHFLGKKKKNYICPINIEFLATTTPDSRHYKNILQLEKDIYYMNASRRRKFTEHKIYFFDITENVVQVQVL